MPDASAIAIAIGAKLRALRAASGLTLSEAARRAGLLHANTVRVERGTHLPRLDTLAAFAAVYGVPLSEIVGAADHLEPGARDA